MTREERDLLQVINLDVQPPRTTWQQKKIAVIGGKPHHYMGVALRQAKEMYERLLGEQAPSTPYTGAIRAEIFFGFAGKGHKPGSPKLTTPDADNMSKLCLDCLQATGYVLNDSQIYDLHVVKRWSKSGYIQIRLYGEDGDQDG